MIRNCILVLTAFLLCASAKAQGPQLIHNGRLITPLDANQHSISNLPPGFLEHIGGLPGSSLWTRAEADERYPGTNTTRELELRLDDVEGWGDHGQAGYPTSFTPELNTNDFVEVVSGEGIGEHDLQGFEAVMPDSWWTKIGDDFFRLYQEDYNLYFDFYKSWKLLTGEVGTYSRTLSRIAMLAEVQKQNQRGQEQDMDISGLTEQAAGLWTNAQGWVVFGSVTNDVVIIGTTNTHYIMSPSIANNGLASLTMTLASGVNSDLIQVDLLQNDTWVSNYIEGIVGPSKREFDLAIAGNPDVYSNVQLRVRYAGEFTLDPSGQHPGTIAVTNLAIIPWTIGSFVGLDNDNAGLRMLVDDNITGAARAAVNQRTLDNAKSALETKIAGVTPSVVGVTLEENPVRWGALWQTRQIDSGLYTSYVGQDAFWFANGGTTFPNNVAFGISDSNFVLRTLATTQAEPLVQYTTDFETWDWYTGEWSSTWPTISKGTVTITIPIPTNSTYMFRAATTSAVEVASGAHFNIPAFLHGNPVEQVSEIAFDGGGSLRSDGTNLFYFTADGSTTNNLTGN